MDVNILSYVRLPLLAIPAKSDFGYFWYITTILCSGVKGYMVRKTCLYFGCSLVYLFIECKSQIIVVH